MPWSLDSFSTASTRAGLCEIFACLTCVRCSSGLPHEHAGRGGRRRRGRGGRRRGRGRRLGRRAGAAHVRVAHAVGAVPLAVAPRDTRAPTPNNTSAKPTLSAASPASSPFKLCSQSTRYPTGYTHL